MANSTIAQNTTVKYATVGNSTSTVSVTTGVTTQRISTSDPSPGDTTIYSTTITQTTSTVFDGDNTTRNTIYIAVSIGAVVLIAVLVLVICYCRYRRKIREQGTIETKEIPLSKQEPAKKRLNQYTDVQDKDTSETSPIYENEAAPDTYINMNQAANVKVKDASRSPATVPRSKDKPRAKDKMPADIKDNKDVYLTLLPDENMYVNTKKDKNNDQMYVNTKENKADDHIYYNNPEHLSDTYYSTTKEVQKPIIVDDIVYENVTS